MDNPISGKGSTESMKSIRLEGDLKPVWQTDDEKSQITRGMGGELKYSWQLEDDKSQTSRMLGGQLDYAWSMKLVKKDVEKSPNSRTDKGIRSKAVFEMN